MKDKIKIIEEKLNIKTNPKIEKMLDIWYNMFVEYNKHTNLISKGDLNLIFEKHVFDSLALNLCINLSEKYKILDVGTGGGFPSVILAIFFDNLEIVAVDSVGKKIKFIENVKNELKLDNLTPINQRVENINPLKCDLIISRAMGKILKVFEFSKKHLKKEGSFVFYKSANYSEELEEFKKKYNKKIEIFSYNLPTLEQHQRKLIKLH